MIPAGFVTTLGEHLGFEVYPHHPAPQHPPAHDPGKQRHEPLQSPGADARYDITHRPHALVDPWPSDYDLDTARHLLTDHLLRRIPRS